MAKSEQSFGVIPLRRTADSWEALMVCHATGYWWSFPKGHAEANESPQQTAQRELREETGLEVVHFLELPPLTESYSYRLHGEEIDKTVTYLLAEVSGQVCLEEKELVDSIWLPVNQAHDRASYAEAKALCRSIVKQLQGA